MGNIHKRHYHLIVQHNNSLIHKKVANVLIRGGVVIVPTETVYGFAVNAFDLNAQKKVYILKKRNPNKQLILMSYNISILSIFVDFSNVGIKLAEKFWPGQLTLIAPTTNIGKILSGGKNSIGVRIPNNQFMLKLLKELQMPIFTTSVNLSKKSSAKNIIETLYFEKEVDIIVDGGQCEFSFESTIIDIVHFPYVVIREGCLNIKDILKNI
jgi:L-threonylcarbamoyladenylate synthase